MSKGVVKHMFNYELFYYRRVFNAARGYWYSHAPSRAFRVGTR